MTVRLFLAKGREKSLLRRHPWVFSGAVQRVEGKALSGETIDILDSGASGWRAAPIRPSRRSAHASGPSRKMKRLTSISSFAACSKHKAGAIGSRSDGLDGYRLIAGESDGMPGITIDRFQNFRCCSCCPPVPNTSARPCFPPCNIATRNVRSTIVPTLRCAKEGLPLAQGPVLGDLPPELLPITEHGMKLLVDIQQGHKTGFYLDQRDSRTAARNYSAGRRVLNCFSYTGAFAVSALMGGCAQ